MRVAAIYDIHGNLPALEAVIAEIHHAKVDRVVVGGDVLPGPMPRETLARLLDLDLPVDFIQGNGEAAALAHLGGRHESNLPEQAREAVHWSAKQLDPEYERVLASWPATLRLEIPGLGDVLFCHATPRSDTEIFTRLTPEERLLPVFNGLDVSLIVCGHTHMQFDRTIGRIRVVNAGSVGMPFGEPGAYWLLLGPDVQPRRTRYDLTRAADRIRDTGHPQSQDFAERSVLQPPSEEAMLGVFSRVELR
jgi:putative phosphoesterase